MTETEKNTVWDDQAMSVEWTGTVLEVNAGCKSGPTWIPPAQTLGLIDYLTAIRDEVAAAADAQAVAHLWRRAADAVADMSHPVLRIERGGLRLADATGMGWDDAASCLVLTVGDVTRLPDGEVHTYTASGRGSVFRYVRVGDGLWAEAYDHSGGAS